MKKCELQGHQFRSTAAPGWFQCIRAIDYRAVSGKIISCGQLAVCPGCLGFVYTCLPVLFCELHQGCQVQDFDVIACIDDTASGGVEQSSYEQSSLW